MGSEMSWILLVGVMLIKPFIEVILFANHKANGAVTNIGLSS